MDSLRKDRRYDRFFIKTEAESLVLSIFFITLKIKKKKNKLKIQEEYELYNN